MLKQFHVTLISLTLLVGVFSVPGGVFAQGISITTDFETGPGFWDITANGQIVSAPSPVHGGTHSLRGLIEGEPAGCDATLSPLAEGEVEYRLHSFVNVTQRSDMFADTGFDFRFSDGRDIRVWFWADNGGYFSDGSGGYYFLAAGLTKNIWHEVELIYYRQDNQMSVVIDGATVLNRAATFKNGASPTTAHFSCYVCCSGHTPLEVFFDDITVTGADASLPVTLTSFTAQSSQTEVALRWRTETETNNLGFNIYRSDVKDGEYVKVNSRLIAGAGSDATPHNYSFTDENVALGKTYYYYIEDVDYTGKTNKSYIIEVTVGKQGVKTHLVPLIFALLQNFPNPFNPETWIPFRLSSDASVTISIHGQNGQLIRIINLGEKRAGSYITRDKAAYWDGKNEHGERVSSGVYFYTLQAGEFKATRRMLIVK